MSSLSFTVAISLNTNIVIRIIVVIVIITTSERKISNISFTRRVVLVVGNLGLECEDTDKVGIWYITMMRFMCTQRRHNQMFNSPAKYIVGSRESPPPDPSGQREPNFFSCPLREGDVIRGDGKDCDTYTIMKVLGQGAYGQVLSLSTAPIARSVTGVCGWVISSQKGLLSQASTPTGA